MASSLARFRQQMKPTPEKVHCVTKKHKIGDVCNTLEEYPTFTRALFLQAFPPPLNVKEDRPEDHDPADPNEYLFEHKFLGSGRRGQAHVTRRRDFTRYATTTMPPVEKQFDLLVVWAKMDARVMDYVDAIRVREPCALDCNNRSPFLCKILCSFRSRFPYQILNYHLICEYSKGQKSFCQCLRQVGKLPEIGAKFYAMELADVLIYIHSYGKIFRRLCMCYLIVKSNGHILLAPYTMCKQNLDCGQACNMLTSNCGDQFYASPEIVFGVDVLAVTDWWSYGVILYQMLTSKLPFTGRTLGDLGKAITESPLEIPSNVSPEATALIKQLLHRDPRRRLGVGSSGPKDIQRHPFFADIDWKDVRQLSVETDPPFKARDYL